MSDDDDTVTIPGTLRGNTLRDDAGDVIVRCHSGGGHDGAVDRGVWGPLCDACWESLGAWLRSRNVRWPRR